jgi:putative hydrolase of the HAD superfamily
MSVIKGILFDLFHTLVDVGAAPGAEGRHTADLLGVGREAWGRACFGELHEICRPTRQLEVVRRLAHSLDPAIPEDRIREAAEARQRRFDHALAAVEADTLVQLRRFKAAGLRLALVSNASTGEVSAWPRSPLFALFDVALFSCEIGVCKPQPAIYDAALQHIGLAAGEALFVGDGGSDEHRGARAVGLRTVLITRYLSAARRAERRPAAEHEVSDLAQLAAWLGVP